MSARRLRHAARWGAGLTLALGIHAAGAVVLMERWQGKAEPFAGAPAILVDFAPAPAAPATTPPALPPGPLQPQQDETLPQQQPAPEMTETVEAPPAPAQTIDVLPPRRPERTDQAKPKPRRQASRASAPSPAAHHARRAVAPAPGAPALDPAAVPNWKSALFARLERYKRYPPEAKARGEQGVAQLAFSIDRRGGVHGARILRSSGSALLDRATLQLIERAQPLPAPPPGMTGTRIAIVVPIRYHIR
jgi:protein TonB